jgi:hypothetical protein
VPPAADIDSSEKGSAALRTIARLGLGARGVTYLLLGWLVLAIAEHRPAAQANDRGAFETLARSGSGRLLLTLLAAGFAGYAVWRLAAALGRSTSGERMTVVHRLGSLGQVAVYGFLCYLAAALALGSRARGGTSDPEPLAAHAMHSSAGQLAVVVAGAVVVIAGAVLAVRGAMRRFDADLRTPRPGSPGRRAVVAVGVVGTVTRGLVVGLVGVFLLDAGLAHRAARARGLDSSLLSLREHPFGSVALVAVAIGVACFGLFSLLETGCRRV